MNAPSQRHHETAGTGINLKQGCKVMVPVAQTKWMAKEARRAQLMHRIFEQIAKTGATSQRMFRMARHRAGSSKLFNSYKRFECLFLAWRKNPCPATLLRKWKRSPGPRIASSRLVGKVEKFAVGNRLTLAEAHRRLRPSISYNTVFRHCKIRREITQLAAIRRAQERLHRREKALLERIEG
jgi:hypothetical protein